jgi:hypothetical protein
MFTSRRRRILMVAASLTAVLAPSAFAAEDAARSNSAIAVQAPLPAPSSNRSYKAIAHTHILYLRMRCAHIGCPGVHVSGISY